MTTFVLRFSFIISIFLIQSISAQISTTTTAQPENLDPTAGGKNGNPGAQIRFSTKALDSIYAHALEKISESIKSMVVPDVVAPIGGGTLTIKSGRITEAKFADSKRQLLPPNKIRSSLINGEFAAIGQWQFKPHGDQRSISQGVFRASVSNTVLNMTNQVYRTWDAKPMVSTQDCKAYLGRFRVEVDGTEDNPMVIDKCDNSLCQKIRSYCEESICNAARDYIKSVLMQKLGTFPSRVNLGNSSDRFVMDYGLLQGEPKVTEEFIQANLEGDVFAPRANSWMPFYAVALSPMTNDRQSMISFPVSDFAFNSLLFQAHKHQYRFSAIDHLQSSPLLELLKLNCSAPIDCRRNSKSIYCPQQTKCWRHGWCCPSWYGICTGYTRSCLGTLFDNSTIDQYATDDLADLVFKSQRPLQVLVRQQPANSSFGISSGSNGVSIGSLEIYGPVIGDDRKREMLAKVDIKKLRGEFMPKMNASNITGLVNITDLKLARPSPQPIQSRLQSITDEMISRLQQLSVPILTEMFNAFLSEYAQFPVPLVQGYECDKPEFRIGERTVQIDCDVRVSANATQKLKVKRP